MSVDGSVSYQDSAFIQCRKVLTPIQERIHRGQLVSLTTRDLFKQEVVIMSQN
jgi:hypothetical protein